MIKKLAQTPGIPVFGPGDTHHFNGHIDMGPLPHYPVAPPHVADADLHFDRVRLVSGMKSAVAREYFRNMLLHPYGIPKEITLDSGGGFFSDACA